MIIIGERTLLYSPKKEEEEEMLWQKYSEIHTQLKRKPIFCWKLESKSLSLFSPGHNAPQHFFQVQSSVIAHMASGYFSPRKEGRKGKEKLKEGGRGEASLPSPPFSHKPI